MALSMDKESSSGIKTTSMKANTREEKNMGKENCAEMEKFTKAILITG